MSIVFLVLIIIILSSLVYAKPNQIHATYIDKEQTTTINGIFVFLVFMSHSSQYMTLEGPYHATYLQLSQFFNQAIVVTFLFYSGYGIMEGIKKKGSSYVNTLPLKALKLWLLYSVAIILYILTNWFVGKEYSLKQILLAFTTWTGIGNSNWYITAILVLYLLTFIAFKLFKHHLLLGNITLSILTIAYVYLQMTIDRPGYTYNTMILFSLGMFYSLYRHHFEKIMTYDLAMLGLSSLMLAMTFLIRSRVYQNITLYSLWMISIMIFILLLTMKLSLKNPLLYWLGTKVFSVYILQRIPMIILAHYSINTRPVYFFLLSFLGTLILSILFDDIVSNKINSLFQKKEKTP